MSNTERIIKELLSLEAWHKPLSIECKSPFHLAVSFAEGRFSGEADTPINFRVKLKKATVVVICDENLRVPKSTKVRRYPIRNRSITLTDQEEDSSTSSDEARLKAELSSSLAKPGETTLGADAKVAREKQSKLAQQREISEQIEQSIEMTYREVDGAHHWDCVPIHESHLNGSAHDGESPVLELQPKIDKRMEDMGVKVFIKCMVEDLDIFDIQVSKSVKERILGEDLENRLRLAKEVIKQKLCDAQLESMSMETRFQDVILADILAVPE